MSESDLCLTRRLPPLHALRVCFRLEIKIGEQVLNFSPALIASLG